MALVGCRLVIVGGIDVTVRLFTLARLSSNHETVFELALTEHVT